MDKPSPNENSDLDVYIAVNEELRRFYDYVVKAFEHLRNKALALLVGEVAIVTFLFQDFHFKSNIGQPQSVPIYGYVFLAVGITLLALSYYLFISVIATVNWQFPTDEHNMKNPTDRFKGNLLEYNKYLHSEYMEVAPYCNEKVLHRSKKFMQGVYCLSAGVFVIVLLKYLGGA